MFHVTMAQDDDDEQGEAEHVMLTQLQHCLMPCFLCVHPKILGSLVNILHLQNIQIKMAKTCCLSYITSLGLYTHDYSLTLVCFV